MAITEFPKSIQAKDVELKNITDQLVFNSNISYVSGGVYIYRGFVYVHLRVKAVTVAGPGTNVVVFGMPEAEQNLEYFDALRTETQTDRKRLYVSNSSYNAAYVGKLKMSNIGSTTEGNFLTADKVYVIRGSYQLRKR